MSEVGCTVSLKPKLDFETHQFKKHARPLPLQLARPSHAGVRYWARSPSAAKDADSLRVDCERVAGSEPAPPSGRIRSCAAAPSAPDRDERNVA
jgi:hypothetical protein